MINKLLDSIAQKIADRLTARMSDPPGIKFFCPSCNRSVVDQWITRIKGETRIRCPACLRGYVVSINTKDVAEKFKELRKAVKEHFETTAIPLSMLRPTEKALLDLLDKTE